MVKDMKIGVRLGVGFGIVLFLLICTGIVGYWGCNSLSTETSTCCAAMRRSRKMRPAHGPTSSARGGTRRISSSTSPLGEAGRIPRQVEGADPEH